MAAVDDSTSCPVCFEDYKEVGNGIPRILPCSHTLCTKCIEDMLKGKTADRSRSMLECPECRTKHPAPSEFRSFPQNKYIVSQMRRSEDLEFESCKKHKREVSLFCKENDCKTPICSRCLTTDHKGHKFHDLQEVNNESYEEFRGNCRNLDKHLQSSLELLMIAKEEVNKKTEICVEKIKHEKEECMAMFDELIEEAVRKKNEMNTKLERDIRVTADNIEKLSNIEEKTRSNRHSEIMSNSSAVEILADKLTQNPPLSREDVIFPTYVKNSTKGNMCGKLTNFKFKANHLQLKGKSDPAYSVEAKHVNNCLQNGHVELEF